jgi:hypothetical protein
MSNLMIDTSGSQPFYVATHKYNVAVYGDQSVYCHMK